MHTIHDNTTTKWWTLAAVCTGVFMLLLDVTIVNVALPDIEAAFSASLSDLQWVISGYALTLAAFLLMAGSLADRYGRRLLFAIGIVIFTGGSLACGVAQSVLALNLSRGVQGVGGAIMFATSIALLAQAFRGHDRGVAFGVFGAITGISVAVGPVIGGLITSGLSWRWIFLVNVPIGIAAFAMTVFPVDESRNPRADRPDWAGLVTFSAGLAGIVLGLIRSQADGWDGFTPVTSIAVGALLLVVFVVIERAQAEPMFDLGLLRVPTFVGGLVAAFAISASVFSLLTYMVIYFQASLGLSAIETGVRLLPLTLASFVASGIAGRLTTKVPRRILIGAGFVGIGTGLILMRGLTAASDWTHLLNGMIIAGVGIGFVNVPLVSTSVGVVEPEEAGMAAGINLTLRQVGLATGVAALGTVFATRVRDSMAGGLSATPLRGHAHAIAHAVSTGHGAQAIATTPARFRGVAVAQAHASFASGLNTILLIGVAVAFTGAVLSFALIREHDFVVAQEDTGHGEYAIAA